MRNGLRIGYRVEGAGTPLIRLHGFMESPEVFHGSPLMTQLAASHQVIDVHHLGHGASDGPTDVSKYTLDECAANVVCVLDDVGIDRAHIWGYSLGSWVASGIALHHPERIRSLVLGGWDLVDGANTSFNATPGGVPSFEDLVGVREQAPDIFGWITPESEPALTACWQAIVESMPPAGTAAAVGDLGVPVLLWNGEDDPYHTPMQAWAATHGAEYVSVTGDHLTGPLLNQDLIGERVTAFLARCDTNR